MEIFTGFSASSILISTPSGMFRPWGRGDDQPVVLGILGRADDHGDQPLLGLLDDDVLHHLTDQFGRRPGRRRSLPPRNCPASLPPAGISSTLWWRTVRPPRWSSRIRRLPQVPMERKSALIPITLPADDFRLQPRTVCNLWADLSNENRKFWERGPDGSLTLRHSPCERALRPEVFSDETRCSISASVCKGEGGDPQTLGALRDRRIVDRLHIDPGLFQKPVGDPLALHRDRRR